MTSAELKSEALAWLRFGKQLDYVCTEGSYWSSDVLGANSKFVIEVEVKVSRADLLAEFRNKKTKHAYYSGKHTKWAPNYFHFLVPAELGAGAVEIVTEKFPRAGVLAYEYSKERPGERLRCLKKPTKLHDKAPSDIFIQSIRRRMGSELCGLHIAMLHLKNVKNLEAIEDLKAKIVDTLSAALGATDWELRDDTLPHNENTGSSGGDALGANVASNNRIDPKP